MFREFDISELEYWNSLTKEQKAKAIEEFEVQVAVDIEIKVGNSHQLFKEHKFYQVCDKCMLIDIISVSKITDQEVLFEINTNGNTDCISIKIGEEKEVKLGRIPFEVTYIIKVFNVKYGQALEL